MTYQLRDRFVKATQLTREAVEAHLWNDVPLPDGFRLARASHHPGNKTIQYFYATVERIPCDWTYSAQQRAAIGDWRVEFSDGRVEAMSKEDFAKRFEAVALEAV